MQKKLRKRFSFWDNSIWKCCNKLPLLTREYLPSAVHGLTNSPKILHITQRDFFNLNYLQRDQQILQRHCRWDFNCVTACLPCYLLKGPLKRDFLVIYLTTFFRAHNFKNTSAKSFMLFRKGSKLNLNCQTAKKVWEKVFIFWYNWIWTCCYKLCLLRREYLFSAVNALTDSPKISHITKGDFFQVIFFHGDQ